MTQAKSTNLNNSPANANLGFPLCLKNWRRIKKMSQLDLALIAGVSQRHLSWLETGRSQPSREMVLKLSEALDISMRETNSMLNSAGFTSAYTEMDLNDPEMAPIKNILEEIIAHHAPYPAFVLDRHWNLLMQNKSGLMIFDMMGEGDDIWQRIGDEKNKNFARLFVHPEGMRRFVRNWDQVVGPFARRLYKEVMENNDVEGQEILEGLAEFMDTTEEPSSLDLLPTLPVEIMVGDQVLNLSSVISTFGTAQDITAQELRVETFYPMDQSTSEFFKQWS